MPSNRPENEQDVALQNQGVTQGLRNPARASQYVAPALTPARDNRKKKDELLVKAKRNGASNSNIQQVARMLNVPTQSVDMLMNFVTAKQLGLQPAADARAQAVARKAHTPQPGVPIPRPVV